MLSVQSATSADHCATGGGAMTQLLFLIVKGNRCEAEEAAATRSIPFVFYRERERFSETWGYVDERHIEAVRAWYHEQRKQAWLTGTWPIGTLLAWDKAPPLPLPPRGHRRGNQKPSKEFGG